MNKEQYRDNEEVKDIFRLFLLLKQTDDAITRSREIQLREYGITPEQSAALICIYSIGEDATPAEISRWLFRKDNSISVLLSRMEKMGLINKTSDSINKHFNRISLTEKGYEAYRHAVDLQPHYRIIGNMSKKKRQQLWDLLQTLRDNAFSNLGLDVEQHSRLFGESLVLDANAPNDSLKTRQ